jgi:hypothetical protein
MWHEIGNRKQCTGRGSSNQFEANRRRKPWFAGKAAQQVPDQTNELLSQLVCSLVSPKQSSNPTPPGCCSAFCSILREYHHAFRVSSCHSGNRFAQRDWTSGGLLSKVTSEASSLPLTNVQYRT